MTNYVHAWKDSDLFRGLLHSPVNSLLTDTSVRQTVGVGRHTCPFQSFYCIYKLSTNKSGTSLRRRVGTMVSVLRELTVDEANRNLLEGS